MKTAWTKGVSKDAADELRKEFVAASRFRERLRHLLDEKSNSKRTETLASNGYENPNWALVQADAIGYEKALKEIISLIS